MTEERLSLADLLAKAGDGDFLRSVAEAVLQMLMEANVGSLILDVEGRINKPPVCRNSPTLRLRAVSREPPG